METTRQTAGGAHPRVGAGGPCVGWRGVLLAAALALGGCGGSGILEGDTQPDPVTPEATVATPQDTPTPAATPGELLVFSKTAGFRHPSITDGLAALGALAEAHGFDLTATEDAAAFTDEQLRGYQAVVFLHTTKAVLDGQQQAAMERYIARGGGFVGIHAAADADPDWTWYHGLIGAPFLSHPEIQPATIHVTDSSHPATAHLPERWQRTDEWYDFAASPRGTVRVLAVLDEATYTGGRMGEDHPIAWCQSYAGGRSFYTALGHTPESYTEPAFVEHLLGGIRYAAGLAPADCNP